MNRRTLALLLALAPLTGCEGVVVTQVPGPDGKGEQTSVFTGDGCSVVVRGGSVSYYNLAGGRASLTINGHRVRFDGRRLSVDGRSVALARPGRVEISLEGRQITVRVDGRDPFTGAEVSEVKRVRRTDRFAAAEFKAIHIRGLSERFELRVEEGRRDVAVLREGYEDELGNLAVSASGGKLALRGKPGFHPRLTIAAPPGLDLKIAGCAGGQIGDTFARVDLTASGSQDYKIGRVKGAKIKASGFGDVTVAAISGGLAEIVASGSGDVKVGPVSASQVTIDCSGFGSVKFAKLTGGEVRVTSSGSGDVELGPGKVGSLSVKSSGFGSVICRAPADKASLTSRGSGNVRVARPGSVEKLASSGFGKVSFLAE